MTFRSDLLSAIDSIRSIPGQLGLRQYQVFLRTEDVSGATDSSHFGQGSTTITETELKNQDGYPYHVESVSQQEIAASGGQFQLLDLKIGPITPSDNTIGWTPEDLNPAIAQGRSRELRIVGPGFSSGAIFKVVGVDVSHSFSLYLIARKVGG